MKNLFEMLQAIFGKNIISRTIGTRTNVIKLPSNKSSPLKNEFDVFRSAEDPAVFEKLKKVIEDEAPYISRMNDAERLIYEGNVKRLHDYLVSIGEIKPTISAEVIGLGTKEPIAGKGLASLVEEVGQTSPPGTLVGDIQSRINKLKSLAKEKGMSAEEILQDFASGQKGMSRLNDEGLVRSTAREILINDIKAGKIKNITVSEAINMGEPLDPFRRIYGEGALEQLDSLIPDFRNLKTEMEAEKFARSKFKFEPDENRLPGSTSIEEGRKAEQEFGINKSTTEVEEPQAEIIPFKKKPEEFAIGGPVGLDYLTGQDSKIKRENYAEGTDPKDDILNRYKAYLKDQGNDELYNLYRKAVDETPAVNLYNLSSSLPILLQRPDDLRSPEELRSVTSSEVDPFGRRYDDPRYYATGGRVGFKIGSGKKILDLITGANKKSKSKITKKPTKEDYEDYAEILNDSENTVVQGTETFDELDALVKKQKDYEASMFQQYKMGKLDPVAGENSENRMRFLQKKLEEASMTKDRRLISPDELNELDELEKTFSKKEMTKGTSLEDEMNMVLNQYDKSMFVKNEQGMVDVTNPENVRKMALLLQRDHPEIYKKLEETTTINTLEDFDVTGRKPNAKGGLNYLMRF
jgi:hypothetical protein